LDLPKLLSRRTVLFDGANGTRMIAGAPDPASAPEILNITRPEVVEEIHRSYVEAGSDILTTNTFGANRMRLADAGLEDKVEEINRLGVLLAKKASGGKALIAGNIGPVGEPLAPFGDAGVEDAKDAFREQARILALEGVDLIIIETMYNLAEAEAALAAARGAFTGPVIVSMTFRSTFEGYFTLAGNSVEQAVARLADSGADVLGANCTLDAALMVGLIAEFAGLTDLPIIGEPCAGQPRASGSGLVYPQGPEDFAENIIRMVAQGADLVGGCCGTDESYIRAVRRRLEYQNPITEMLSE
jgi:5-methyltetrahydrofolate--homocysteine methyltransferase